MNNNITNLVELRKYLGKRLAYYDVPKVEQDRYDQAMKLLEDRCADPRLYLGVVGEVSTGKSTFINALMGMEILKEDILPGTTCAPTILAYGEHFEVEIYEDDSSPNIKYSDTKELRDRTKNCFKKQTGTLSLEKQINEAKSFIMNYTANEERAKDITKVVIYLPSRLPIFENDICIVDTPGINAENPRHQDVTCQAVKQICDLSLVLTPATAPCSRTLLSFINNESLTTSQSFCIGLITQIDRVRLSERKRQVIYVNQRLTSEGIHLQDVFAIAPCCVLHPSEYNADECEIFQAEFNTTISKICEILRKNKSEIVALKLQAVLSDIIANQIKPLLADKKREITERYNELENNKLGDFDLFIQYEKENACNNTRQYDATITEIESIALLASKQLLQVLTYKIENASSRSELKDRTEGRAISKYTSKIRTRIINEAVFAIEKRINEAIQKSFSAFEEKFNMEFRDLVRREKVQISTAELQCVKPYNITLTTGLKQVGKSVNDHKLDITGGVTTGAIIGTILLVPVGLAPVGALIGASVGGFISSLFGKSLEELKNTAKKQSIRLSEKWRKDLIASLTAQLDKYYKQMEEKLTDAIDGFVVFKPQVLEIISNEKKQQEQMKLLIEELEDDENLLKRIADKPREVLTNLPTRRV